MKKFAKLSLVASIALASTSFANAQALEEAIKTVDISGTMAVRYNDYENGTALNNDSSSTYYKVATNLKSKVNDDVTANVRIIAGDKTGTKNFDTQATADSNLDVSVSEVNFLYTGIKNSAIRVGKQGINTAFTISRDAIGTEQTGSGIVAITNVGPVNLSAGYFNNTNLGLKQTATNDSGIDFDGSENLVTVGAKLNIGSANIDASYLDVSDKFDAFTVGLNASYTVSDIALNSFARYSSLDKDSDNKDNTLWKAGINAKMGIFGAAIAYGETNKEGGDVALDGSATTGMDEHWRVTLTGNADSSVVYASVNAQVMPKLNVALKYSDMERKNDTDLSEVYVQTVYSMSKNFVTYVRFGQLDKETSKDTSGRLHMQYSF